MTRFIIYSVTPTGGVWFEESAETLEEAAEAIARVCATVPEDWEVDCKEVVNDQT